MFTMQDARERLLNGGLAHLGTIRGCSQDEIDSLESHYKLRLPSVYKEFLSIMGHGAGMFSEEQICFTDFYLVYDSGLRRYYKRIIVILSYPMMHLFFPCIKGINLLTFIRKIIMAIHLCSTIWKVKINQN